MAAVPLFWNSNMAAVTSCENALLRVATFLPVAYIFIQGTLESKLDETS